ncbi:MAG: flavin reductase [Denitrovibrio sp.]|nr:MAG: flavin reductase [Denitrovibrio sp.]
MNFKELEPTKLKENPFTLINNDWMLISAGDKANFNTMTASWGGLGIMWHKNVASIVVRPTRYTFEFLEKYDYFTLSFFEEEYKDALTLCGTKSGRDCNKVAEAGLTPIFDNNGIYFEEAKIIMVCKKLYWQDINPDNFVTDLEEFYPKKDYHRLYMGEIENMYEKWIINPLDLQ